MYIRRGIIIIIIDLKKSKSNYEKINYNCSNAMVLINLPLGGHQYQDLELPGQLDQDLRYQAQ